MEGRNALAVVVEVVVGSDSGEPGPVLRPPTFRRLEQDSNLVGIAPAACRAVKHRGFPNCMYLPSFRQGFRQRPITIRRTPHVAALGEAGSDSGQQPC